MKDIPQNENIYFIPPDIWEEFQAIQMKTLMGIDTRKQFKKLLKKMELRKDEFGMIINSGGVT